MIFNPAKHIAEKKHRSFVVEDPAWLCTLILLAGIFIVEGIIWFHSHEMPFSHLLSAIFA